MLKENNKNTLFFEDIEKTKNCSDNSNFYKQVLKEIKYIENDTYREKLKIFLDKLCELASFRSMDIEGNDDINGGLIINLNFTNQKNGDYFRSCFAISRVEFNNYYKKYSIDNFANRYFNSLLKKLKKVN